VSGNAVISFTSSHKNWWDGPREREGGREIAVMNISTYWVGDPLQYALRLISSHCHVWSKQ